MANGARDLNGDLAAYQAFRGVSSVLGKAGLGTWFLDCRTGEAHFGRRWLSMLGIDPPEQPMTFEDHQRHIHPDDRDAMRQRFAENLRGDTPFYRSQHRLRHADGHWVWVLGYGGVTARDADGRALVAMGVTVDITDMKRAEERERLLAREVDHRAKNLLAVVQSVV